MRTKNCLVTGASSGIGRETSIQLSHHAKHIYIVGRNVSKLEEVNDLIVSNGCECTIVPLDLCEENSIENLSREISKKDSSIDYLILCAGIISQLFPINSIDYEKFKEIIIKLIKKNKMNLHFSHYCCKEKDTPPKGVVFARPPLYTDNFSTINENAHNFGKLKIYLFGPNSMPTMVNDGFIVVSPSNSGMMLLRQFIGNGSNLEELYNVQDSLECTLEGS